MPPPQALSAPSFFFSIKSIRPNYEVESRHVTKPPDSLWIPPSRKEAFTKTFDTTWHYWQNGAVQLVPPQAQNAIQTYRASSMFWGHARQAFLVSPCDCTETDIRNALGGDNNDTPLHWRKITFYNRTEHNRCLSVIGYNYEHNQLGARGSTRWMPALLPQVYQHQGTAQQQQPCQLAGDLSLLLGLVTFSTPPGTSVRDIGDILIRAVSGNLAVNNQIGAGSKAKFIVLQQNH